MLSAAATSFGSRRAVAQEFTVGAYGSVEYDGVSHRSNARPTRRRTTTASRSRRSTSSCAAAWATGRSCPRSCSTSTKGNEIGVDLDRFQVGYEVGDWLKITAGRFHTSLGYYNTAYPQGGAVYLLPMDRPARRRPARQRVDRSDVDRRPQLPRPAPVRCSNASQLRPGRRQRPRHPVRRPGQRRRRQQPEDAQPAAALRDQRAHPRRQRAGRLDPAARRPADPATDQPDTLREQIFGAHIAYVEHPWHLIAEGYHISHIGPTQTQRTLAGLAELGYTIGQVTPYARYEFARFPIGPRRLLVADLSAASAATTTPSAPASRSSPTRTSP